MPFIPHTPESLIRRSDSKDPATTCKGITASGRPCRRPLGTSPQSTPTGNRRPRNGVVAILEAEDDGHDGAAAFFCWQHQDQADMLTSGDQDGRKANIIPVQERTSIDTLVDRLGILDMDRDESPSKIKRQRQNIRAARKETLPVDWQNMDGPLLAVNSGRHGNKKKDPIKHTSKRRSNLGLFCCVRSVDDEPLPPPRTRPDAEKVGRYHDGTSRIPGVHSNGGSSAPPINQRISHARLTSGGPVQSSPSPSLMNHADSGPVRPPLSQARPSQTEDFLSLIPKTLSPQITSLLLAELAKPISPHDEEGYIYMFWLTDTLANTPDAQIASSLLADTLPSTPNGRRKSDILQSHASRADDPPNSGTILLKIGRASNVQRRMNEWTRQCGYNLSLIRFYPHVRSPSLRPGTAQPPGSPGSPLKVSHAHKVERLIHIELADQRVRRSCENCGKEHKEWFEVAGNREGLKKIDDTIKRWTSWGQRTNGQN